MKITEKNVNHRHKIDILKLQRQIVSASAKRKATEDICERPAKILHSIATVQDTSLIKVSDVKYIKRNMYNARRNLLPTLPNTTQSVQEALNSMKYKSSKGEDMLLYNDFNSELVEPSLIKTLDSQQMLKSIVCF
ncbi:hypothetical protein QTP88_010966 [Uroleucon formosanum]